MPQVKSAPPGKQTFKNFCTRLTRKVSIAHTNVWYSGRKFTSFSDTIKGHFINRTAFNDISDK